MNVTEIQLDSVRKIVHITVAGKVSMKEAEIFIADYKAKTKTITPSQYILEVDCTDMKLLTPDMTDNLTSVMQMYKESGFKKVIYQVKDNPLLKLQLSRLARNAGVIRDGQDVSFIDLK